MKTVAYIPIKFNSERVPNKNIKKFSDGAPLMRFIQQTLLHVKEIDEIYCYCSSEKVKEYLLDGVIWLKRDEKFDRNDASPNELHRSFCEKVDADIYVASHATSPFTTPKSVSVCIEKVASGSFDSAILGKKIQEFLYADDKPFNFSLDSIPRTQDLKPLYEEVNGAYVFTREIMFKYNSRTGGRVYIHPIGKIEGIDIDYPEDFEIADAVYTYILKGKANE
jgi:CMP-N-acetylneuraminic acid synthetase